MLNITNVSHSEQVQHNGPDRKREPDPQEIRKPKPSKGAHLPTGAQSPGSLCTNSGVMMDQELQ